MDAYTDFSGLDMELSLCASLNGGSVSKAIILENEEKFINDKR